MIFDIAVFSVLAVSGLIAIIRGFLREVLTIAGIAGALVAAYAAGPAFSGWLEALLTSFAAVEEGDEVARILGIPVGILAAALGYGLIFIIVLSLISLAAHFMKSWAQKVGLGIADRVLGLAFGLARGGLIIAVLFWPFQRFVLDEEVQDEQWYQSSFSVRYVEMASSWVGAFLPEDTEDKAREKARDVRDKIEEAAGEKLPAPGAQDKKPETERAETDREAGDADAAGQEQTGYGDEDRKALEDLMQEQSN